MHKKVRLLSDAAHLPEGVGEAFLTVFARYSLAVQSQLSRFLTAANIMATP